MVNKEYIFNNLPFGLLVIDAQGIVTLFNRQLAALTKLEPRQYIGRSYLNICQHIKPKLLQTLETGIHHQNLPPSDIFSLPRDISGALSTHPIYSETNDIIGAMAVFRENQREKELEQAVFKAEKLALMGQMAAGAVHEIKNPLTTIKGFLQLIQNDYKGTTKEEYLSIMLDAIDQASKLLTDFLQLARPGYIKRIPCQLSDFLKELSMLVESEAIIRKVNISTDIPEEMPPLTLDPEQIRQVLLNIVKNSMEAMPLGGQIYISAAHEPEQDEIFITISDTGIGIEPQALERIFEPFMTTKETGTGLGMFISRNIVKGHGGRIMVESQPGAGCQVTIALPVGIKKGG